MTLFLDDDPTRTVHFRKIHPGVPVTVETAAQCIERLRSQQFKVIFLDHDLGGQVYVDPDREDTGMEVVRWLCQRPACDVGDPDIVVHSMHHEAALKMVGALQRADYRVHRIVFGCQNFNQAVASIKC